jgi:arylsulfatase A-like enzyme
MNKPNIFILTIDSLRKDKIFDETSTAVTPNFDWLKKNSSSFTQAISASDETGRSLGCLFTGLYPYNSKITHFNFNPSIPNLFSILSKNGYTRYATIPDVSFFMNLTKDFEISDPYVYDKRDEWLQLNGGVGKKIIQFLKNKKTEPWIYYIHLMDLHSPFFIPKEFNDKKYGKTRYERMISSIDVWLGNILKELNLENTLLIITADHGEYIPIIEKEVNYNSIKRKILKKGQNLVPFFESTGVKLSLLDRAIKKKYMQKKYERKFSKNEMKTLQSRGQDILYDDVIRIPLFISGKKIPVKTFSEQVSQVDILPTIFEHLDLKFTAKNIDGKSLCPLFLDKSFNEEFVYIESGSRDPKKLGNVIGLRTPKFKYFRSRINSSENKHLYDLTTDPSEEKNLIGTLPKIEDEMENILLKLCSNSTLDLPEFDEDTSKEIENELRKLGYL